MNSWKAIRVMLLLCIVSLVTAGCWNNRELTNMSIVIGMGVDTVPNSEKYRVSFQIVNAGALQASGSSQGGTNMLPIVIYSETNDSLFGALRKVSRKVPRRLFFGHIQLVVVGDSAARKGLQDIFDFFERSHEVRMNSTVLIARDTTAESIISAVTPIEKLSSIGTSKRSRTSSAIWAGNIDASITDVVKGVVGAGGPAIGGIKLEGEAGLGESNKNLDASEPHAYLKVQGVSLFRDNKLVGWLDGNLARSALQLRNNMKSAVIELPCEDSKTFVVMTIVRSTAKITPKLEGEKLTFSIAVKETGNIVEANCPIDLDKRETIIRLQKQWTEMTKQEVMKVIQAAQAKKSDVFGFGEAVKRHYPKQWKSMEKDWPEYFSKSEVAVSAESFIRRTGMRSKSYQEEKAENANK